MLVRSGLPSRQAAKAVLEEIEPYFLDSADLRNWLRDDRVAAASSQPDWPSTDTARLWKRYREERLAGLDQAWHSRSETYTLPNEVESPSPPHNYGRIHRSSPREPYWVTTVDFVKICPMPNLFVVPSRELNYVRFSPGSRDIEVYRTGPPTA
jgi:hypothetical protein